MWLLLLSTAALLAGTSATVQVYNEAEIPPELVTEQPDQPAEFGPELPVSGVRGYLVVGDPRDGCQPLSPPPQQDLDLTWIVLIARYNCSFEEKVRNAQSSGYILAIVHNVNSSKLEHMSAQNASGILIPSVFVGNNTGEVLASYNYATGMFLIVNDDMPFDINTHLLLPFAVVVVLCLFIILVFMIVKCIKDRRRARRHRLPNRCLKKIPTCKFSKGDPYETCAICLDDYQEGERLRVLPCAHAYHSKCIDPWLTQNKRVCPVCKRKVFAAGERRRRATSDSDTDDTEPLMNTQSVTESGTFVQQSENPFRRAERFMARLRAARLGSRPHQPGPSEETEEVADQSTPDTNYEENDIEGGNAGADDTRPLVEPEPRRREGRRSRRARRARSHPAAHSINAQPAIGVAALPVQQPSSMPRDSHIIDL